MATVFTYFVSFIFIVIAVFITLTFKIELERMFREDRSVFAFHICNVVIILMVAFASQAVMRIYILGHDFSFILNLFILMAIIMPTYVAGHFAFEKYNSIYRKYAAAENGKVLVLNEKYLKKKKWFRSVRHYNAGARED
ncbi:hypothetical protein [Bacillus sp. FJAT-27251]|uniref:hypothetical protein n=1 Tax=Bacillus sp. FJAT-27251 TaxID=1684142 RepID=UPI0006A76181|nr:hypothetical protein [Bacillus sp. FJAT-27251]